MESTDNQTEMTHWYSFSGKRKVSENNKPFTQDTFCVCFADIFGSRCFFEHLATFLNFLFIFFLNQSRFFSFFIYKRPVRKDLTFGRIKLLICLHCFHGNDVSVMMSPPKWRFRQHTFTPSQYVWDCRNHGTGQN